jgi:LacI family transcriptional regulator
MYHQLVTPPAAMDQVPSVLLDARVADNSISSVDTDEFGGAYAAITHLVEVGHRRIGYLQNADDMPATRERLAGFRSALADHGLDPDSAPVAAASSRAMTSAEVDEVQAATESLLSGPDCPTALFCFNDRMASGVYRTARALGAPVPDQLSVVGFDNQELVAPWLVPGLTTLQLPHYEMGKWAVEQLLRQIEGSTNAPAHYRMPCPLVERGSVVPPRP